MEHYIPGRGGDGIHHWLLAASLISCWERSPDPCAWEAVKLFSPLGGSETPDAVTLVDASTAQYCKTIRQVMQHVKENLSDSSLSLNRIASNILYLNPDYLGKLFKKECGVKFSDYLVTVRMEKAKQIIAMSSDLKMYEVARQVGLGDSAAYFGQVFRKYTGMLPSEYRIMHGCLGECLQARDIRGKSKFAVADG